MLPRKYPSKSYSPFQSPIPMSQEAHELHKFESQEQNTPETCQEAFDPFYYPNITQGWPGPGAPSPSTNSTLSAAGSDGFSTPGFAEQQGLPDFGFAGLQMNDLNRHTDSGNSHPDWSDQMAARSWHGAYQSANTWNASSMMAMQRQWPETTYFSPNVTQGSLPIVPSMPQLPGPVLASTQPIGQSPQSVFDIPVEEYEDTLRSVPAETVSDSDIDNFDYTIESNATSPQESMMRVHKFTRLTESPVRTFQHIRPHRCNMPDKKDPNVPCSTRFVRPEHLRRHRKTVHAGVTGASFPCKVTGCKRRFNRGDNLRDHYFTHVERGGRAGSNVKLSLRELKDILGPNERELFRKLVLKYKAHMEARSGRKRPTVQAKF